MTRALLVVIGLLALGCGLDDNYGKTSYGHSSLAITNAEGEANVLRTGTNLDLMAEEGLRSNAIYHVVVANLRTTHLIGKAALLTDTTGRLPLSTVAQDIGEFDDLKDEDSLQVKVTDTEGELVAERVLPLTPHIVHFVGHGFQVDEVQPPHVYSADPNGTPLNAFVVGGPADPGEAAAPIYAAGDGFPKEAGTVDIYIVKDQDLWRGREIPKPGMDGYVLGPVIGKLNDGVLPATKLDWLPAGTAVGTYDILVDVDRNGKFDYAFSHKDGADGENKVGFTVQYGQAFFRAKTALTAKHILVNLAYTGAGRSDGRWANSYNNTDQVYTYVNPPVMLKYHAFVTKLIVPHQSWSQYWNNPEKQIQSGGNIGGIPIPTPVQTTGGTTQHSCTNTPPVVAANAQELQPQKYDVVFDFDNDGIYDPGKDLLDVVADRDDGSLVTAADLSRLADADIFGFMIK